MDDLARIHTFIKVAELGSLSAAARHMDTSVTSIARQLNSLERQLAISLITRSSRKLTLTEPGKLFYQRARVLCADLQSAMQEASSFQESVKGTLRISLRPSIGNSVIVPALPEFLSRHPDLKIDISFSDARQDLIANDIDVAVWMGTIPDSDLIARRLSRGERIACASPEYLKARGTPQTPNDLRQHDCILFVGPTYGSRWCFTRDASPPCEVEVTGRIKTDNAQALYSAALSGGGVMVVHEWGARSLIAQGRLARVLPDYEVQYSSIDSDLHAVYARNRGMSRKVRAFVDFLVELFQKPPELGTQR